MPFSVPFLDFYGFLLFYLIHGLFKVIYLEELGFIF